MRKYALLIGVGEYGEGLTSLPAAPRDVAAFAEVLQNPQMGGFDEVKSIVNPSQAEMAREIELWFQGRDPDDLVLLFFSGHGVKDDRRELFFAACNTEKQRDSLIRSTATSAQFILNCIRWCKAKYQVIILDCCYSGAFGDFLARDDGEINLKEQLGAEGCVVLTATNAVDYAYEEKGSDLSIYTRYLVEGIVSGAADEDEDGVITVEELHRFAARKVEATSPAMSPKIITLKDEGYRIRLARSPQDDPKVKYRKEVERRATAGQFSIPAKRLLISFRRDLDVSDEEAEIIESEVLKPYQEYQRKRQEYQDTLRQCMQNETTLSYHTIKDLTDFRDHLRLRLEDVVSIEKADLGGLNLEEYISEIDRKRKEETRREQQPDTKLQPQLDTISPVSNSFDVSVKTPQTTLKSPQKSWLVQVLHSLWLAVKFFVTDLGLLIFPIITIVIFRFINFPPLGIFMFLTMAIIVCRTVIAPRNRYKKRNALKSILFGIRRLFYSIFILWFSGVFVRSFIQEARFIETGRVSPDLQAQDRVLIDKNWYWFHMPKRGEIVLFNRPLYQDKMPDSTAWIGRIIGMPGETVEIEKGEILINGQSLILPFKKDGLNPGTQFQKTEIPSGSYLIIVQASASIMEEVNLLGRADAIFWPLDRRRKLTYRNHTWIREKPHESSGVGLK